MRIAPLLPLLCCAVPRCALQALTEQAQQAGQVLDPQQLLQQQQQARRAGLWAGLQAGQRLRGAARRQGAGAGE